MKPALESAALRASSLSGELSVSRLKAVLLGAHPSSAEKARIHVALSVAHPGRLEQLAGEIGLSFVELDLRYFGLYHCHLAEGRRPLDRRH